MRSLSSFNSKLLKPCRRLFRLVRLPYKRLTFRIFRKHKPRREKKKRSRTFFSAFWWRSRKSSTVGMDRIGELRSFISERDQHCHEPFPSPMTPAFVKLMVARRLEEAEIVGTKNGDDAEEEEEACRSFENYLVEMIVEEGKVRDLTDVEELLYCWSSLKSPVFVDLVSRFYGELCMDLFSHSDQN